MEIPAEPVVFSKWNSAIVGPDDDVEIPRGSAKTDWEVELGVVIGKAGRYIDEADAMDHVAGYCAIIDVSERAYQLERGDTWDKGKGCDTFGPIGPWLVTRDQVDAPQDLRLWLEVDGRRYQDGSTRTMIFTVREIVLLSVAFHEPSAWRRHLHRNAARRWAWPETAGLSETRTDDDTRHRRAWRTAPARRHRLILHSSRSDIRHDENCRYAGSRPAVSYLPAS